MKKIGTLLVMLILTAAALTVGAAADYDENGFDESNGTPLYEPATLEGGVYQTSTDAELYWFAGLVNGTLTDGTEKNAAACAVLTKDITIQKGVLAGDGGLNSGTFTEWTPIGDSSSPYTGTFDGGGHTISGLYCSISGSGDVFAGLFGYVDSGGTVQDLTIADSYISGTTTSDGTSNAYAGGVCGRNSGTITDCFNSGTVSGTTTNTERFTFVGGVCGWNDGGTIKNCSNSGAVSGTANGNNSIAYVGGVCGTNSGTITGCFNSGAVSGSSPIAYVGGVCGWNYSTIENCSNSGAVSGTTTGAYGSAYVGGVCGWNYNGTITSCSNSGTVSGSATGEYSGTRAGGVCGTNSGTITNCYWLDTACSIGIGSGIGSGGATSKTADQFASGQVTWLLNGESTNGPWRQTLDEDAFPVLDDTHGLVVPDGSGYRNVQYENGFDEYDGTTLYQPATLEGGVYQISNAGQLYWFAQLVNGGDDDADAVLTADITINEGVLDADGSLVSDTGSFIQWTPIGNGSNRYTGTFDGGGHTISGLYVDVSGSGTVYAGLFGSVGSGGTVQNLTIADSYISGTTTSNDTYVYVGGVCGTNYGTITGCSNSGTVEGSSSYGSSYVGGVCGSNYSTITGCSNSGTVKGSSNHYAYVGGVCGYNGSSGEIENCSNSGAVSGTAITKSGDKFIHAGGVCGENTGTITGCFNFGAVSGTATVSTSNAYVGGVCGYNSGTITGCFNFGAVSGTTTGVENFTYMGGVCGWNTGTITSCFSSGKVSASGSNTYVGGVCGVNVSYGTITNCYWLDTTCSTGIDDASGTSTNVEPKTTEEFASGQVAWLLNSQQENGPWRQTLGQDDFPVLEGDAVVYRVTFTVADEDERTVYSNSPVTLPGSSEKPGYHLVWSDGEGNTYNAGEVPITADASFTGQWTANSYTVTFQANGGEGTMAVQSFTYDSAQNLTANAFTRSGYTFAGWSTTVDGGVEYTNGQEVVNLTAVDGGAVILYAVWTASSSSGGSSGSSTYTVTAPESENGTVTLSPSRASKGTTVTVTVTPDEGYELASLTVTRAGGSELELTDKGNGKYTFTMPASKVTVEAVFAEISPALPFTDVAEDYWAYDEIAWAWENGCMSGTAATTFNPGGTVSRQQVWMILARMAGADPADMAEAKAWAVDSGVSDGTNPGGAVTRQQLAALLYRYAVQSGYDVSVGEDTNILSYTDAFDVAEYAIPAMQWACGAGIINGTGDGSTLSPQGTATRAQLAVMLYRWLA